MSDALVTSATKTLFDNGSSYGSKQVSESWQLPSANYLVTPAIFNPVIYHPRPDIETSTRARHRLAYVGIEYRIPIKVYGGTYPFKYELTGNTTAIGATIGETLVTSGDILIADEDYGVVSWTPAGSGTFTIEVLVTDQSGRTATVSYEVVAGTSTADFVFVSTAGNDANDGSIGSPVTISDLDSGDHAGKVAYFRTGAHVLDWETLDTSVTPASFVSYPGESATISCANNRFSLNSQTDIFFGQVVIDGNPAAITKQFTVNGALTARHCFYNVTHQNMTARADSNGGAVDYLGTDSQYIVFDRPVLSGVMGPLGTFYGSDAYVIEGLTGAATVSQGTSGNHGIIYLKQECTNFSIRNNDFSGMTITGQSSCIAIGSNNTALPVENNEVCYNKLKQTNTTSFKDFVTANTYNENAYYYRNTMEDGYRSLNASAVGISTFLLGNIAGGTLDSDVWATLTDNLESNTDIDANLNLTGATRTTYLGKRGAEVAS